MPLARLANRISPRSSLSATNPVRPRTFGSLAAWPEFERDMQRVEARLDKRTHRYIPVLRAGNPATSSAIAAAADECEVRAPLQNAAELVNDVARDHGIRHRLRGGGSNRSTSGG